MVLQDGLQRKRLRLTINKRKHVHAERGAQRGELQQFVEDLVRIPVALHLNVDAHPVAVRLVTQVGDAVDATLFDQVGDLLNE